MAKSKGNISVGFQIVDQGNGLQKLKLDADDLQKALQLTAKRADSVAAGLAKWAPVTVTLSNIRNALGQLHGALNDLTAEAGDFGGAMRKANTMAGASG